MSRRGQQRSTGGREPSKYLCRVPKPKRGRRQFSLVEQTVHPARIRASYSKLDEFCGDEDFEKARISIDWMNTCLKNFSRDYNLEFCSRNMSYFCAIGAQSDGCLQSQSEAQ
jgi:hypothetical protein